MGTLGDRLNNISGTIDQVIEIMLKLDGLDKCSKEKLLNMKKQREEYQINLQKIYDDLYKNTKEP